MASEALCRACKSGELKLGLDLGNLPLANSFISPQNSNTIRERRYPLRVFRCNNCGLLQLLDVVDRKEMFDDYSFLTATASTSLTHFEGFARDLTERLRLGRKDLVVDIGSNDGTLLKAFQRQGTDVIGVEPARNVANRANADGVNTLVEYFSPTTVKMIGAGKARVVTANNVVSHVGDLNGFIENVHDLLAHDGVFAFEVPWVVDVLRHNNFDIVYHEHLSYFGFRSLAQVLRRNGLEMIGLEYFPHIHGGSIRGLAGQVNAFSGDSSTISKIFLDEEREASFEALENFALRTQRFKNRIVELLHSLKKKGKSISGYGAPAKATIVLNYCNIDTSILDFVSDTTPLKQGKLIPGVRIPIVSPDEFHKVNPDYALLLAWNYKQEIMAKESSYIEAGGKFIIPFPELEIVG